MEDQSAEDLEMIDEFLVESEENLSHLDRDLVDVALHPDNLDLLGSIFRTVHTIKGACGFLGFAVLESVTVQAECLLGQLRDGKRELTPDHLALIKETAAAARALLGSIRERGNEGGVRYEDLTERLRLATL